MNDCRSCKHKETLICDNCDDGNFWEKTHQSFDIIISAVMFGCGIGGIVAAIFSVYS